MALDVTSWLSVTSVLSVCTAILLSIWTWKAYRTSTMFKRLGIPGPSALPFLQQSHIFLKEGFIETFDVWAKKYPKIFGCFVFGVPTIVVSDLDLVRDMLIKKFGYFPNRALNQVFNYKPWSENLLNLKDDHWKHVRSELSPTFSAGKLRKMTLAIERVVKNLQNYVQTKAESGEKVELKAMCRKYAIDVIAGVAFGLQADSLKNPEDPFLKHGHELVTARSSLIAILLMFPRLLPLLRKFGISFPPKSANSFFISILDSTLQERRLDTQKHSDFLQLLVEAEREGEAQGPVDAEIDHGDQLATSKHWTRKGLTQDEMYGNTLIFLFAGNETLSTVMSFTLFCLAGNPDCLAKAQAEVDEKLGKRAVNYETANQLSYLDMCMNETMRIFPPGFILDRQAAKDVEFAGYPVTKGMNMIVPVINIHRDPSIWPDPMKFDPERHTPEARASRHPFAFMPFGMGPRNCIGMRLAQLEIRMAIATILQHFTPVLCHKSVYPPKLQKFRFESKDGLWVKFEERA